MILIVSYTALDFKLQVYGISMSVYGCQYMVSVSVTSSLIQNVLQAGTNI